MAKYAPAREDGLKPYVVTKRSIWTRMGDAPHPRIEYAENLTEAKRQYGWTRELHATVSVRRATPDDMAATQ